MVDYVNEIYEYMRMMERAQSVKKDYLAGKTGVIIPKMRSVLVEWLVEVHQQFALLQETLYLSVAVLDRYMQVTQNRSTYFYFRLVVGRFGKYALPLKFRKITHLGLG